MSAVGLFAGIGGMELGFAAAGIRTELLCEIDPAGQQILGRAFRDVPLVPDVLSLEAIPAVAVVAAGFPCQNLSLVGTNDGIFGEQSGLIREVFRLISAPNPSPRWLVLENVPFMLWHKRGHAIRYVTAVLEDLGYRWAYRVVDTRAFGLPQRRRRVLLVASKSEDPRTVLFADDAGKFSREDDGRMPCGFSWTEGRAGLGWAVDAVPTLKGGSAIGIPSAPAIWWRSKQTIATPDVRDGERLQGFEVDWTATTLNEKPIRLGQRWKLVGNAVSVPVAKWLGDRLCSPGDFDPARSPALWARAVWPNAAWGERGKVYPVHISEYPRLEQYQGLEAFIQYALKPLSAKASSGFLKRARIGSLRFAPGFLDAVAAHVEHQATVELHRTRHCSSATAA